MRSRFHVMFVATGIVALTLALFLVGATNSIAAQGSPTDVATSSAVGTSVPTATVFAVDATNNRGAFLTRVINTLGLPSGSVFDIRTMTDADVSLDTQAAMGVNCGSVVVYRETAEGDLVLHPATCSGNLLTFKGTGGFFNVDYFVVAFGSAGAANAAPASVVRNLGVRSLPVLGGGNPSSSSVSTSAATPAATSAATVMPTATMSGTTTP